jgi:hypothetical protein
LIFKYSIGQNINISNDKNDVLYIGVDNPLTTSVGNLTADDISVKVNTGQLFGGYGRTYNYRGSKPGIITFSIYAKSDPREIGQVTFRAKYVPDPIVTLKQSKGGIILQSALKTLDYLRAQLRDFDCDARFSVDSFRVTIVHVDNCTSKEFFNIGSELKKELRTELSNMNTDDFAICKDVYSSSALVAGVAVPMPTFGNKKYKM